VPFVIKATNDPAGIDPRNAFLELWRVFPEEISTGSITEEKR